MLESKCVVGRTVELSNGCIVGAGCVVDTDGEVFNENTVVSILKGLFGYNHKSNCRSDTYVF